MIFNNIFLILYNFLFLLSKMEEIADTSKIGSGGFLTSLITILISGIISILILIIKGRDERKKIKIEREADRESDLMKMQMEFAKNDQKITERDRLIQQQMIGLDNKVVQLSMDMVEIKGNSQFKKELMNSLREISANIIDYNVNLGCNFKNVMMIMAREIEDFALRFYYSDMRGVEHEIVPYLKIDMESRIFKFKIYLDFLNLETKTIMDNGIRRKLSFLEFIADTEIRKTIDDTIKQLSDDGLKEEDVIELFQKFLGDFFKEFIKSINSWENIEKQNLKDTILKKSSGEIERLRDELKFPEE